MQKILMIPWPHFLYVKIYIKYDQDHVFSHSYVL